MGSSDDILQGVATPGLYDRMFNNLRHPNALATKPIGAPVQAKPADTSAGVRAPASSPLLGAVPGLDVAADLKVPPFLPFTSDKTPANANDQKSFTPPTTAPDYFTPQSEGQSTHDRGEPETEYTPGRWPGPFTPDLATQAGFAKEEAADWANLANWMTRGESYRDDRAFTELFGGEQWTGSNKDHPYYLGWSGATYQGKPTSAYGPWQDEAGTWHNIANGYLKGDTTMTPVSMMKGNLLMAADLYSKRTGGRNILADFKAGNVVSIASNLSDQWPTLFGSRGMGRTGGAGDAAFEQWRQMVHEDINAGQRSYERLMAQANAADPMSEEMHHYLHRAMEEGEALSKRYKDLEAKPPTSRTPMEAASGMAPILMLFAALGGFASRRPALAAMNATNGFLEGLKQGNDEQFANNVNLWKLHTNMAKEAFDMQTTSIRTIMDDITLTDSEKQHKLQDAFRFWQMDQDLRLARENEWAKVYERQDERERNEPQRRLEMLHIQAAMDQEADRAKQIQRGSWDLPPNKLADYDVEYDKKAAELQRPLNKQEQDEIKEKVMNKPRVGRLDLTTAQRHFNDEVAQAKKEIGDLPTDFDDELTTAMESRKLKDVATLSKKEGWGPRAISLYRALLNPGLTGTKTPADDALMKKYQLSRRSPYEPSQVIMNDAGTPTGIVGGGASAQAPVTKEDVIAAVRADSDAGESPEAIKAKALQISDQYGLGITSEELDQIIKGAVKTPTGSVARPPQLFPVAPGEDPAAIGLTPYM